MSNFLRLANMVINKNYIQHIVINNDKLVIHLFSNKMKGNLILGGGTIKSYNTEIEVCKTKQFSDYKIVTEWINDELK